MKKPLSQEESIKLLDDYGISTDFPGNAYVLAAFLVGFLRTNDTITLEELPAVLHQYRKTMKKSEVVIPITGGYSNKDLN